MCCFFTCALASYLRRFLANDRYMDDIHAQPMAGVSPYIYSAKQFDSSPCTSIKSAMFTEAGGTGGAPVTIFARKREQAPHVAISHSSIAEILCLISNSEHVMHASQRALVFIYLEFYLWKLI